MHCILDTNILILLLNGDQEITSRINGLLFDDVVFCLPAVVITEFYSKPILSHEVLVLKKFFGEAIKVIPVDYETALLAGSLRLKYSKFKLGDALIAATTIITKSVLVTNNMRDFTMIDGLRIV